MQPVDEGRPVRFEALFWQNGAGFCHETSWEGMYQQNKVSTIDIIEFPG